jgi:hypothetical protein
MSQARDSEFLSAALDADVPEVASRAFADFLMVGRIMRDPLVAERAAALSSAWWESEPFKDLDYRVYKPDETPSEHFVIDFPDFYMQAVQSLTRAEKLALRKRVV